jgi:ABC-2 type transport system permease protein
MSLLKTWAIFLKELRHILRDPGTFILATVSPVFLLIVFTYSLSVDIQNVSVAMMDMDQTDLSRQYLALLASSGDLLVDHVATSYQDIDWWMERGDVRAAVVVPSSFAADARAGRPTGIQIIVDGTDPNTAGHAITHIVGRTQYFATQVLMTSLTRQGVPLSDEPLIDLRVRTWYNPDFKFVIGIAPALIAVVLSMPAVSVSLTIAREKEKGTLEGLAASPLSRAEIMIGKIVPYVFVGLFTVVLCVLVAVLWFQVPFRGSPPLYLLLAADYLFAMFAIGLLISVLVNTQQVAIIASILIFMFSSFFTSGIFFPISAMGPAMKMEAMMVPATHFVFITRGVFVKGTGLAGVWSYSLALFIMGLLFMGLTVLLFKKKVS